jgi:hypothetical protein
MPPRDAGLDSQNLPLDPVVRPAGWVGNGENVKIAARYLINHAEPINFCRSEAAILAFITYHGKPARITENGLFSRLYFLDKISYYPCREWSFHETSDLAVIFPASRWMVKDHIVFLGLS